MNVLLDTHVALALLKGDLARDYPAISACLCLPTTLSFLSVASLWETAIKTRLGKLDPGMKLEQMAGYYEAIGLTILAIEARHVATMAEPEPPTHDLFDRRLLAQCQVENLLLATVDRALVGHPMALKTTL